MRSPLFLAVLLAGALVAVPASAQPTGEQVAEKLFNEAIALVTAGKYADACPKLEESQRLDPALGTQFNLADCYEHTGRKGSARRLFIEVADAAKAAGKAEREKTSRERAAALEPVAPRLTISVPPSATSIRLEVVVDGAPFPQTKWNRAQPFDAGTPYRGHLGARKEALRRRRSALRGRQGQRGDDPAARERARRDRPTGPTSRRPRPATTSVARRSSSERSAWSASPSAPARGLLGREERSSEGALSGFQLVSRRRRSEQVERRDDAGTVSTIGFVAGGAILTAAAILYFAAPKNAASSGAAAAWWVTPSVGLGSAGLVAGGHL